MRILAVAAHPDDEVLGCGGTLARYSAQGHEVHALIVGEGITSRHTPPFPPLEREIKSLHQAGRSAHALLGIQKSHFLSLPDNRLDSLPLLDVIKPIEALVHELNPHVIFTHHQGDLNVDHGIVHRAVLTAARPGQGNTVKTIYAFETLSSTEWRFDPGSGFSPNVFVDISATLDQKVAAMEKYQGELRAFPHPRSARSIRDLARLRGATANQNASEAFMLIRDIIG